MTRPLISFDLSGEERKDAASDSEGGRRLDAVLAEEYPDDAA